MKSIVFRAAVSLLAVAHCSLYAQNIDSFDPSGNITPSVETFEMTKYGMISPSMFTGAMSFSVPIYTYEDPNFRVPISLDYNFDGYRPAAHSGTVGYGWSLNCGGVITREVRGFPDEGNVFQNGTVLGWAQAKALGITYNDAGIKSSSYALDTGPYGMDALIARTYTYDALSETPAFVTSGGVKCDPAPDIFHFNFCGISGDFIIQEDGSVRAFNTSVPYGELAITFTPGVGSPNIAGIVIRSGDGTKYYFGGSINNVETFHSTRTSSTTYPAPSSSAGVGSFAESVSSQVTAFRLYKIESPANSNRRVEFCYSSQRQKQKSVTEAYRTVNNYGYSYQRGGTSTTGGGGTPSQDATYLSGTFFPLLDSIRVNGSTIVTFSYENKSLDEEVASCYDLPYINGYVISAGWEDVCPYSKRLSAITVRNSSKQFVAGCSLTQTYASSGTPKMFLSSITGLKTGDYGFSYNLTGFTLPKNDTKGFDHWGYWNGQYITSLKSILKMNNGYPMSDLYDQINGSYKEAYNYYSKCGALTSITYPTGGMTTIEYEGNTVGKRRTNTADAVACTPYEVGGVRVKRLTHSAESGDGMEDHVTYIYSESKTGGATSGILTQMPRYAASSYYSYSTGSSSDESFSCDGMALCFSASGNGFPTRDSHIGYSSVIEVYEDGSWKKNSFSSTAQTMYCDSQDYDEDEIEKKVFGPYDDISVSISTPIRHPITVDRKNMRGQLLRTDLYDAQDSLRKTVTMTYSEDAVTLQKVYFNNGSHFGRMHWSARSPILTSQVETAYEAGGALTKTTSFTYNSSGQMTCKAVEGGAVAGTVKTYYRYREDTFPGTEIPAAVEAVVKTRSFGLTERIISKETYTYTGNNIHPASYTQHHVIVPPATTPSTVFSTGVREAEQRTTTFSYDSFHRLIRAVLPGEATYTYIWSGNNIAVKSRQGNMNNIYIWKDLVGPTKITEPSGLFTTYVYDGRNRLQSIRDVNNYLMTKYTYYFNNDAESSASSGLGGDNYIAVDTYTSASGSSSYKDVSYYNGLGYEEQTISTDWAATGKKLVTPIVYDNMRRPDVKRYLPYPVVSSTAYWVPDAVNTQKSYYLSAFSDTLAYAATAFETSPAGRPLQITKEGTAWIGHASTVSYRMNASADTLLTFSFTHHDSNPSVARGNDAIPGTVLCTSRTDEDGREVRSFTDSFGRLLCHRVVNADGNGKNADTYYVYDLRDSLVCVLPPQGIADLKAQSIQSFSFSDSFAAAHCFLWWRDGYGRPEGTSAPGGGRNSCTYDSRGRISSTWSKAMEDRSFYNKISYDAYDRVTARTYENSADGQELGGRQDYSYYNYNNSNTDFGTDYVFVADEVATAADRETTKVKGFLKHETLCPAVGLDRSNHDTMTRGREYYYDKYGRVMQVVEVDSDGWKARYSTKYDFLGNVIKTRETHTAPGGASTSLVTTYTRDKRGKVLTCSRTLGGAVLASFNYTYDDLGRLYRKSSTGRGNEYYYYDIHGWRTVHVASSYTNIPMFTDSLYYSAPRKAGADSLWSGLVSETKTLHYGKPARTYDFHYDNALRLADTDDYEGDSPSLTFTEKDISYDGNGNTLSLKRYGNTLTDNLLFQYSANRLTSVSDQVSGANYSYTYDLNGNLASDSRKDLQITYNVLNLPMKVMRGDTMKVQYEYLPDGTKLSALTGAGAGYKYRGTFVYAVDSLGNERLESVAHDEGRITVTYNGSGTASYRDEWHVKDHLRNVRVVLNASPQAQSPSSIILEQSDYLPFGDRVPVGGNLDNRWRYAGKEEQRIAGEDLAQLDFGARHYDPWLTRWTTQDPMAVKYTSTSPYAYCANNPVNLVDKDGKKLYFAKGSSKEFQKRFAEAVKIMNRKGISYNIAKLDKSESIYYIAESCGNSYAKTGVGSKTATLFWNPNSIVILNERIYSSPVTVLAHEASHVAGYDESPEDYSERKEQGDSDYGDKEEKRVIEEDEQIAARELGEITPDMVTRNDHLGTIFLIPFTYSVPLVDIIKKVREYNLEQP